MKRLQSIAFLFSLVFVSYSGAQAVPCHSLVPEWLEGRFVVVNQPTSKMLALQQITFGLVQGVGDLPRDAGPLDRQPNREVALLERGEYGEKLALVDVIAADGIRAGTVPCA